jgi:hypothetical protein
MIARGRSLRFTVVVALVALALTGFSTGSKGRHSSGRHGGGGGGCSSSSQDHDSSSSSTSGGSSYDRSYGDDDDDYGSSGSSGGSSYTRRPAYRSTPTPSGTGGSGGALEDGTARLVTCATKAKPYATVEVANPNSRKATFTVDVLFLSGDTAIDSEYLRVTVPARSKKTVKAPFDEVDHFDLLDQCEAGPYARLAD